MPWPRRAACALLVAAALAVAGCGDAPAFRGPASMPAHLVPPALGSLSFVPQTKATTAAIRQAGGDALVATGQAYLVEQGKYIAGSVEVYLLKPDVRVNDPAVFSGLDSGIAGSAFKRVRLVPDQVIWEKDGVGTRAYLWFPPRLNTVEILTVRHDFTVDQQLVAALVDPEHGRAATDFAVPPPPTPTPAPPLLANPTGNLPTTVLPTQQP